MRHYWTFMDELAVINRITMKGKWVTILVEQKQHILNQSHNNHMSLDKTKIANEQIDIPGQH